MHTLLIVFTIYYNVVSTYSQTSNVCNTPLDSPGQCIPLASCPVLSNLLLNPSSSAAKMIRGSHCGYENRQSKVCCPLTSDRPPDKVLPPPQTTAAPKRTSRPRGTLFPSKQQCGPFENEKIVGGKRANIHDFPWIALLQYTNYVEQLVDFGCSGSLITQRYVLTAGHCIKTKDNSSDWILTSVRLGGWNMSSDATCEGAKQCSDAHIDVGVASTLVHQLYNPNDISQYNDIALVRMISKVQYTDFIKPICLPNTIVTDKEYEEEYLVLAGWKNSKSGKSDAFVQVRLPVISHAECAKKYRPSGLRISSKQMCAGGEEGKDSCQGDSGGPLMVVETKNEMSNWYLVGLVSFGPTTCATKDMPGVYTKVGAYSHWIKKNVVS